VALLVYDARLSPVVPFLCRDARTSWILSPTPVSTVAIFVPLHAVPTVTFLKDFPATPPSPRALLSLRALGAVGVTLNGHPVTPPGTPAARCRDAVLDVSPFIQAGSNRLRVDVSNPRGPAVLQARLEGAGPPVVTDATWLAARDAGAVQGAMVADDTRPFLDPVPLPTPASALRATWPGLLGIFLASALLALMGFRRISSSTLERLPALALAGLTVTWLWLFVHAFVRIPLATGFDVVHHLVYIEYVRTHLALPLATEGLAMYHPPLFYVLSAGILAVAQHIAPGLSAAALKLLPFLCGLGNIWVVYTIARILFPRDPAMRLFTLGAAGAVPMNLYMSAYISNESLHAFAVSLCLLLTVRHLRCPRTRAGHVLALGMLGSLALLTKFTAVLVVPLLCGLVAAKFATIERRPPAQAVALLALLVAVLLAGAGWYYARNIRQFGRPLVGNWELAYRGQIWWQQPGFHTARYYLRFGASLVSPYFAGFQGFWDALYSTFWGDGYLAGAATAAGGNPIWQYDYMSVGYWLALPATAVLGLGVARMGFVALRGPDPVERWTSFGLIALLWVVGTAMLDATLRLPYYAQAKAFYGLSLVVPVSLAAGYGFASLDRLAASRRFPLLRAAGYGWLGTLVAVVYLSYGL
jgi:hypothetical protein